MFGGQDDNAAAPQDGGSAPQDDTLKGVDDLAASIQEPATTPAPAPDSGFIAVPSEPAQASVPAPDQEAEDVVAPTTNPAGADEDLMELKQQALQQLSPLVSHLDQTPLERFRTTMMLIQASDNQALLKDAYAAAQAIEDDKTRAQALLDVINEINYFTQPKQQD